MNFKSNLMTSSQKITTAKIIVVLCLIIVTIFVTRSCSVGTEADHSKYTELVTKHVALMDRYKTDSLSYATRTDILTSKINDLKDSKDSVRVEYVYAYNKFVSEPRDTVNIVTLVETCSDLVEIQDSIIKDQDTLIINQLGFIEVQSVTITGLDSLLAVSNESLLESIKLQAKTEKKLKRTRRLGVAGFFAGAIAGGLIVVSVVK